MRTFRRRRYLVRTAIAAAVLILAAIPTLAATAGADTPTPDPDQIARAYSEPVAANGIAQSTLLDLVDAASAALPDVDVAGTSIDTNAGTATVYTTLPEAQALLTISGNLSTELTSLLGLLHIVTVPMGMPAMEADLGPIGDLLSAIPGLDLRYVSPDPEAGIIDVQLGNATADQIAQAQEALAAYNVSISSTSDPAPTTSVGTNSAYDSSPFAGADFITSVNTTTGVATFCTSAVGVTIGGVSRTLTAGHCGTRGWTNETYNGTNLFGSGHSMGTSYGNTWNTTTHLDQQILPADTGNSVWTGDGYQSDSTAGVTGDPAPSIGESVCTDGAYEGTACYGSVQKTPFNACSTIGGIYTCHIYEAIQPNHYIFLGEGDSGGPVVLPTWGTRTISTVRVLGLITGEAAEKRACPAFTWRGNVCSDTLFFTGIGPILAHDGATLKIF